MVEHTKQLQRQHHICKVICHVFRDRGRHVQCSSEVGSEAMVQPSLAGSWNSGAACRSRQARERSVKLRDIWIDGP